jgi:hypothetical protein
MTVPSGWYRDPTDATRQRYHDGRQWTDKTTSVLDTPGRPRRTRPPWTNIIAAGIVGVILLAIAVGAATHKDKPKTIGKYEQTWSTSYINTTCDEWLHSMTDHERFVGAHDLANTLKAKDTSDAFAREFAVDLSTGCDTGVAGLKLADVAAGIATLATGDFN